MFFARSRSIISSMRTLSVRQPYATLIVAGVKKIENRTWRTEHRGRIYIHASGDQYAWPDADCLPESYVERMLPWIGVEDLAGLPEDLRRYHDLVLRVCAHYGHEYRPDMDLDWLAEAAKKRGYALPSQAVIGEVDIVDVVRNSGDEFGAAGQWHWILGNPSWYTKPIANVIGKLRLWEFGGPS